MRSLHLGPSASGCHDITRGLYPRSLSLSRPPPPRGAGVAPAWPRGNSYRQARAVPGRLPVAVHGRAALARSCKLRHWRLETNYGSEVIIPDTEPQSDQASHSAVRCHHPRVTGHSIDPDWRNTKGTVPS